MSTSNSAVFDLQLPAGWTAVSLVDDGVSAGQLVAVRDLNTSDPVVTNLAVGMHTVTGRPNLASIAETAVNDLRRSFAVTVLNSDADRTDDMSQFNQLLKISYPVGDSTLELRQLRILVAVPAEAEDASGIMQLVMTTPVQTFHEAAREFRDFVATLASGPVSPRSADAANGEAGASVSHSGKD